MGIQNVIYALTALAYAARVAAENVESHGNLCSSDIANVTESFHNFENAAELSPLKAKAKKTKEPTTNSPTNFPTKATKHPTEFPTRKPITVATKKPTTPASSGGNFKAGTYEICPWITGYVDQKIMDLQNKNTPRIYEQEPYYMKNGKECDYAIVYYTKPQTGSQLWSTLIALPDTFIDQSLLKALYTSEEYRKEHGSKLAAKGTMDEKGPTEFNNNKFMKNILEAASLAGAKFEANPDFSGEKVQPKQPKWSDGTKVRGAPKP